jgi:nucleoside-diphosphate-sugar epimerase
VKILLTGAGGFVGTAVRKRLGLGQYTLVSVSRKPIHGEVLGLGDMGPDTDWTALVSGCDVVIHLAARVHVMNEHASDPYAEYFRVNVRGTRKLAEQAAAAGVKRLIFMSSIKVNGEKTLPGRPFTENDIPAPKDPYGLSKYEAELAIQDVAKSTSMDYVIIRSPLIYGRGVKANFQAMMNWLARGLPLPLKGMNQNRRSIVGLSNLVDLIVTCLDHKNASNEVFLISDGEDVSTASLLKRLGVALEKPAKLFYVPDLCLRIASFLFRKQAIYQRLCESLQVDIGKTKKLLDWVPPYSLEDEMKATFTDPS